MEFFNYKKSEKIIFLILTILCICLFVSFGYELILKDFDIQAFVLFITFGIISIIFSIIILITFGSKTILQENGVTYKTIFRSSFHSWDEINFVAEYKLTLRSISTPFNGIICSFDLEKDDIKFHHFAKGAYTCNKHYFCFPYSGESINYIIANLPSDKFLGLVFTDESFN